MHGKMVLGKSTFPTTQEIWTRSICTKRNLQIAFQVCKLTDRSRAHRSMSLWEIEQQDMLDKHGAANRQESRQLSRVDLNASIEKTVAEAVQKRGKPSESDASRTKNIQGNRAEEKQSNRETEVFRPGLKKPAAEGLAQKSSTFRAANPTARSITACLLSRKF